LILQARMDAEAKMLARNTIHSVENSARGEHHNVDTQPEPTLFRKCAVCGREWMKRWGTPEPKRCPGYKCRSKRWRGAQS
jgi:hypothetical protein